MLNFKSYKKNQKNAVKENRLAYDNLLSGEVKGRTGFFFKSFEKFNISIVDHMFDFLNKGNNEEMNDTFYCETCKMTINCAKRFNFLKFPEVLAIGFDYDPSMDNSDDLPLKVEQTINLSFFVSEDDVENQHDGFTKYLSTINEDIGKNSNKAKDYATDVYRLKGVVQLKNSSETNRPVYSHYFCIKGKWLLTENGKQKALSKPPSLTSTSDSPVVFCYYEKDKEKTSIQKNIKSQLSLNNKMKEEVPVLSIPDEFVYKLLYLNTPGKPTLDFFFCEHKQLKPLYQDIYGFKKKIVDFEKNKPFPYIGKKKFNKELEEYKTLVKKNMFCFDSPGVYKQKDTKKLYSKDIDKQQMKHSNTIELNELRNANNEIIDCSFARLNYLANSVDLPNPIAGYLTEEYNFSNKGLRGVDNSFYAKKCQICTIDNKMMIIRRILQKAMIMNFLKRKKEKDYLIDICWFRNFKLFLLADLSSDNLARQLFNHEYVTEKFNINMHFYYTQFKHSYGNQKEMLKNEFVTVNNSFFWFLREIYGCEDIITIKGPELDFLENKEFEGVSAHFLTEEENIVHCLLTKFMNKTGSDVSGVDDIVDYSNLDISDINLIPNNKVKSLLLDVYDDLLLLNKQMNVLIRTKIGTTFSVFDSTNETPNEAAYLKNLRKVYKLFGTNNLDAIDFDPCKMIKEVIEKKLESGFSFEVCPSIDRMVETVFKESNVIKHVNNNLVNDFLDGVEEKKKRIIKTRSYLENIELSHKRTEKVVNKKSAEFEVVNKNSLFSKDSSIYTNNIQSRIDNREDNVAVDKDGKENNFKTTKEDSGCQNDLPDQNLSKVLKNKDIKVTSIVSNVITGKVNNNKKSYFSKIDDDNVDFKEGVKNDGWFIRREKSRA